MIRIETVSHDFGEDESRVSALADVSLTTGDAELVAVVGPSGCGKSTLPRLIAGPFVRPWADPARRAAHHRADIDVGLVFQSPTPLPWVMSSTTFCFRCECQELSAKSIERARELPDLAGLAGFEQRMPDELSGACSSAPSAAD
jgi:NitT/TauT family transport system ATP-binding protein